MIDSHHTKNSPLFMTTLLVTLAGGVLVVPSADAQEVSLLATGDIEWSVPQHGPEPGMGTVLGYPPPPAYTLQSEVEEVLRVRGEAQSETWTVVPFLNRPEARGEIKERLGREVLDSPGAHTRSSIIYPVANEWSGFDSVEDQMRYPLRGVREIVRGADVAFTNLEMPLSDRARHTGAFMGRTAFADALRWAGFDVVSIANNHAFDAMETGLLDTMTSLRRAGVGFVGGGENLEEARKPHIVEVDGISIGFLAYTWSVNLVGAWGFPGPDRSGVMPLDPILIEEDIERVRAEVDYVALSFHWAVENSMDTHPEARNFAHRMIDAGADLILGHHPHVPRGVEVYDGGVIFYSLGNLIFGHNHTYWGDNYLARVTLTPERITGVEVIPVAGEGNDMSQPYPTEGARAQMLLRKVQELTAALDTNMEIVGDVGVIRP